MELISKEYRDLCTRMHQEVKWGKHGYKYVEEFLPFLRQLGCTTLLDYGCGQNTIKRYFAETDPSIEVTGYDPAIPEHAHPPTANQFVVCINVMEHVEEQYVPNVLRHICSLAQVGAHFTIGLTKSKKFLPDGTNAHITVQPIGWWLSKIEALPWRRATINRGTKSLRLCLRK